MNSLDPIGAGIAEVESIVARARASQGVFEASGSQLLYDRAAQAVAWAIMEPSRNKHLAELAVETTGLGNVPDKITKNHRKTLGLMRDIAGARTYGVISNDPETGITEIARPIGVIGARSGENAPRARIKGKDSAPAGNSRSDRSDRQSEQRETRLYQRHTRAGCGGGQCVRDRR